MRSSLENVARRLLHKRVGFLVDAHNQRVEILVDLREVDEVMQALGEGGALHVALHSELFHEALLLGDA